MSDYILSVTNNSITLPPNLPNGQYRLVKVTPGTSKKCGLHSWQIIESYININTMEHNQVLTRCKRVLKRSGYEYVEDLKDAKADDILNIRDIGGLSGAFIFVVCEIFSVKIKEIDPSYEHLMESCRNVISLKS